MNAPLRTKRIYYPDSDGQPMSENDQQYRWIVTIKGNLEVMFRDRPDVYIAADHLIYAQEGQVAIRQAPDTYVAFGRPKGDRGSYKVWEEDHIFPQVIFEILSPGNRGSEMVRKFHFYEHFGAEEYYVYDPDTNELSGWLRNGGRLEEIPEMNGHVSPRLGIRFHLSEDDLTITRPDGQRFLSFLELAEQGMQDRVRAEQEHARAEQEHARAEQERLRAEQERVRAEQEQARAEQEQARAEQERARAEEEKRRAEKLAAKLRELGLNPDQL